MTPAILRPGGLPREVLEAIAGVPLPIREGGEVRAPGMLAAHYAPDARLELVEPAAQPRRVPPRCEREGRTVGVLAFTPGGPIEDATVVDLGSSEEEAARRLYAAIRELDATCDVILAWPPEERGLGLAIADRLRRAATGSAAAGGRQSGRGGCGLADRRRRLGARVDGDGVGGVGGRAATGRRWPRVGGAVGAGDSAGTAPRSATATRSADADGAALELRRPRSQTRSAGRALHPPGPRSGATSGSGEPVSGVGCRRGGRRRRGFRRRQAAADGEQQDPLVVPLGRPGAAASRSSASCPPCTGRRTGCRSRGTTGSAT